MRLKAIAFLAVLALFGCNAIEGAAPLRALPPAVGAETVVYARNETFGFGPGGNETGFNVIRLGEKQADLVGRGGIAWLNAQPGGRLWPDWAATPVPHSKPWLARTDGTTGAGPTPTIAAVLDRYGFGFDVPPEHQAALDAALNAPGSFYAFGPGGLVAVIVPATRTAYVVYAG